MTELVQYQERGLTVLNEREITDNDLVHIFAAIFSNEDGAKWQSADLFIWCQEMGLDPMDYIDPTQVTYKTLQNRATAARMWPTIASRRWKLTISHYIAVCTKKLTDEQRVQILDLAEQGGLSRDSMRELVKSFLLSNPEDGATTYNPQRLYDAAGPFLSRSKRIFDWASANGLPDDLFNGYDLLDETFRKELQALWEYLDG